MKVKVPYLSLLQCSYEECSCVAVLKHVKNRTKALPNLQFKTCLAILQNSKLEHCSVYCENLVISWNTFWTPNGFGSDPFLPSFKQYRPNQNKDLRLRYQTFIALLYKYILYLVSPVYYKWWIFMTSVTSNIYCLLWHQIHQKCQHISHARWRRTVHWIGRMSDLMTKNIWPSYWYKCFSFLSMLSLIQVTLMEVNSFLCLWSSISLCRISTDFITLRKVPTSTYRVESVSGESRCVLWHHQKSPSYRWFLTLDLLMQR